MGGAGLFPAATAPAAAPAAAPADCRSSVVALIAFAATFTKAVRVTTLFALIEDSRWQNPPGKLTLGGELTSSQFFEAVDIDECAETSSSNFGYYFEGGHATGLKETRCDIGGTCRCRRFSECTDGDCIRVWPCTVQGGEIHPDCRSVINCEPVLFDTLMEVKVLCSRQNLTERNEEELDFFGMRWKQGLATDCGIGRVCRFNGDTSETLEVVDWGTFRTGALNNAHVDIVAQCAKNTLFRFNRCTVLSAREECVHDCEISINTCIAANTFNPNMTAFQECILSKFHHSSEAAQSFLECSCNEITGSSTFEDMQQINACITSSGDFASQLSTPSANIVGGTIVFNITAPEENTVKCAGSDDVSDALITSASTFWDEPDFSVAWEAYFVLSASSTGNSQELQTTSLSGTYHHVCSARPTGSAEPCPLVATDPPSTNPCFPGWSEVVLSTGERIQLRDLKTDDEVLCFGANGTLGYCTLRTYINAQNSWSTPFLELNFEYEGHQENLTLTPDHLVFRSFEDISEPTIQLPDGEYVL
eukprot:gene4001-6451_t